MYTTNKKIIEKISDRCIRINEVVKEINYDRAIFDLDINIKEICCFNILQIGELVRCLDKSFIIVHREIEWSKIIGMRNIVAHGYGNIDFDIVWDVANKDIIALNKFCTTILKNL